MNTSASFKFAFILSGFAFVCILLILVIQKATQSSIQKQQRQYQQQSLLATLNTKNTPSLSVDYELDCLQLPIPEQTDVFWHANIYRAWHKQKLENIIIQAHTLKGYNGSISFFINVSHHLTVSKINILKHQETPGLGDRIEAQKSNWLSQFSNTSLLNPKKERWILQQDGGHFDAITGATITSRALVDAIYQTLQTFQQYQPLLLHTPQNKNFQSKDWYHHCQPISLPES